MKFKCICTVYCFTDEQLVRSLDPKARLTKSGRLVGWFTRKDLDKLEQQRVQYTVLY